MCASTQSLGIALRHGRTALRSEHYDQAGHEQCSTGKSCTVSSWCRPGAPAHSPCRPCPTGSPRRAGPSRTAHRGSEKREEERADGTEERMLPGGGCVCVSTQRKHAIRDFVSCLQKDFALRLRRVVMASLHGRTCWLQCSRLGPAAFPTGVALPAVVEPDEENPEVVLRAFADQKGIAPRCRRPLQLGPRWAGQVGADA